MGKCTEVVLDEINGRVPLVVWSDRRQDFGIGVYPHGDQCALYWSIRDATDESTKRYRDDAKGKPNTPLSTANASNLECSTAHKNDEHLDRDLCKGLQYSTILPAIMDAPMKVIPMK